MLLVFGGQPAELTPGGWDHGAWDDGTWDYGNTAKPLADTVALAAIAALATGKHPADSVNVTDAPPLIVLVGLDTTVPPGVTALVGGTTTVVAAVRGTTRTAPLTG